jgi:hypothetical protein
LFSNIAVHAQEGRTVVSIVDVGSFTDATGTKNIVGTVENNNNLPVQMLIGLNTTNNSSNTAYQLIAKPYGKIIYPYREAPFKIKLSYSPDVKSIGKKARTFSSPTIFVTVDGTLYRNSVTMMKGYTYLDLNIPTGKHIVNVSGIG